MKNLDSEQLLLLATSTALKIAKGQDEDELLILADFFSFLGSALVLIHDRNSLDPPSSEK